MSLTLDDSLAVHQQYLELTVSRSNLRNISFELSQFIQSTNILQSFSIEELNRVGLGVLEAVDQAVQSSVSIDGLQFVGYRPHDTSDLQASVINRIEVMQTALGTGIDDDITSVQDVQNAVQILQGALNFFQRYQHGEFRSEATSGIKDSEATVVDIDPTASLEHRYSVCLAAEQQIKLVQAMVQSLAAQNMIAASKGQEQEIDVSSPLFCEFIAAVRTALVEQLDDAEESDTVAVDPEILANTALMVLLASDRNLVASHNSKDQSFRTSPQTQFHGHLQSQGDLVLDENGELQLSNTTLPRAASNGHGARHISTKYLGEREQAVLNASLSHSPFDVQIFKIIKSTLAALELSQSSVQGIVQNTYPIHMFQSVIDRLSQIILQLEGDAREGANARVTVDNFLAERKRFDEMVTKLFSSRDVGGCLGQTGLLNSLDHQIPVGSEALDFMATSLATMYNGAHPEETAMARIEQEIHEVVRSGDVFGPGWEKGGGLTTTGGTASNNIATMIAIGCAGGGLALKNSILKTQIVQPVSVRHQGQEIDVRSLTDDEALMLSPDQINRIIEQIPEDNLQNVHKRFKQEETLQMEHTTPLVLYPMSQWTHYTFASTLEAFEDIQTQEILLNEQTQLDVDDLKMKINADRAANKVRPVIIALTFANTGLGRAGFDPKRLREFNQWCEHEHGFVPTYIVDAAQGGIIYGLDEGDIDPELIEARNLVNELAISVTMDAHKYDKSVPASMLAIKYWSLAKFMTSREMEHSYIDTSDVSAIRESNQLSTDLASPIKNWLILDGMRNGWHREVFSPVLQSATDAFEALNQRDTVVTIAGKQYIMTPLFDSHTGILGCNFCPNEEHPSLQDANQVTQLVSALTTSKRTPISTSRYTVPLGAFVDSAIPKVLNNAGIDPTTATRDDSLDMIRMVFRQAGQDGVITTKLPELLTYIFAEPDLASARLSEILHVSEDDPIVVNIMEKYIELL